MRPLFCTIRALLTHVRKTVILAFFMLTACGHLPQTAVNNSPSQFSLEGRMAIQFPNQPDNDSSGQIEWQEWDKHTQIRLATPFGNTLAQIDLTPTQATYKSADGSVVTETSADMLFYRLMGMDLPLANLHDWIGSPNQPLLMRQHSKGWDVDVLQIYPNTQLAKGIQISRSKPEPMTLVVWIDQRSDIHAQVQPQKPRQDPTTAKPDVDFGTLLPATATKPH